MMGFPKGTIPVTTIRSAMPQANGILSSHPPPRATGAFIFLHQGGHRMQEIVMTFQIRDPGHCSDDDVIRILYDARVA